MSKTVKKAVIPAAGLGTRFLPASKTVPKELFPIVDKPILLFLIEELIEAGIEDIVLVSGRGKGAIEDFFDTSFELEYTLEKSGKVELLESIKRVKNLANIISIRQKQPLGLGHAVLSSKPVIGNNPFALLLGDEMMFSLPNQKNTTEQLVNSFNSTGISAVTIMEVDPLDVSKYGIVQHSEPKNNLYPIVKVIEKPKVTEAPSRFALPGRYVFDAKIYDYLENVKPSVNGEIQLTDGMTDLAKSKGLNGIPLNAIRYDAGDKLGYLLANLYVGLNHPEIANRLGPEIKKLMETMK